MIIVHYTKINSYILFLGGTLSENISTEMELCKIGSRSRYYESVSTVIYWQHWIKVTHKLINMGVCSLNVLVKLY
jgi:hypothetical protein